MTAKYAVTMNGTISTELKPRTGYSLEDELSFRLNLLNGKDRFALLLWTLPDGVPFDRVDLASEPTEYIQCAGGISGRFTCELRRFGSGGAVRHEVIGRADAREHEASTEVVQWGDTETAVGPNEVLDREAIDALFRAYLASPEIPSGFQTRKLERSELL